MHCYSTVLSIAFTIIRFTCFVMTSQFSIVTPPKIRPSNSDLFFSSVRGSTVVSTSKASTDIQLNYSQSIIPELRHLQPRKSSLADPQIHHLHPQQHPDTQINMQVAELLIVCVIAAKTVSFSLGLVAPSPRLHMSRKCSCEVQSAPARSLVFLCTLFRNVHI